MLDVEVLVGELLTVDGFATGTLDKELSMRQNHSGSWILSRLTLLRVKSPPWSMKSGITRWNVDFLYP